MPMTNRSIYRCYAFSLVELAMVLLLVGLMLGAALSLNQSTSDDDCITATKLQLRDVDGAIQRFARANDRLPMPASRTVGVESTTYGREASGGAIDTAGSTSWGALPFQALGLAPSYASDCWGNKLTYVVTTALTTSAAPGGYLDHAALGTISVLKDASTNSTSIAGYAVISHGEDALGAVKNNYSGAAKGWCTGAVTLATQNCLASAPTVANAVFNNGKDAGTAYFDDIVIAGGRMLSVNGKCDNSVALGCTTGSVSNDNGQTACGTTRTWHCDGANGGTNDTSCTLTNAACAPSCGPTDDYGSCTGLSCDICCNGSASSCANGMGGDIGMTLGAGCDGSLCPAPPPCTADGASSGGNPASCCNGDSDGNGTCGTQLADQCVGGTLCGPGSPTGGCGPGSPQIPCAAFPPGDCANGVSPTNRISFPSRELWDCGTIRCVCGDPHGGPSGVSDRRLKTNILQVASRKDFNIYEFSYRNDPAQHRYRGVMAQEVMGVPNAVVTMPDGYYAVNYSVVGVPFEQIN